MKKKHKDPPPFTDQKGAVTDKIYEKPTLIQNIILYFKWLPF